MIDKIIIVPQPDWVRPASGGTNVWHGYCNSGPEEGIVCPFGVEWEPQEIDDIWYWVRTV